MRHTYQVLCFLTIVGFVFAAAGCGGGQEEPTPAAAPKEPAASAAPAAAEEPTSVPRPTFSGEPVRIGLQAPLSGPQAVEGLAIQQAVELVVADANASGGVAGREVILLVEDDRGDPATATQAAERLVSQGVAAVIGSANAATTDPASYVYNRAGILHFLPSCAPPLSLDKGFHQTFRVCFRAERTPQATADFVTEVLDAQRIAIVHDGGADAIQLAEQVRQAVAAQGAEVVGFEAGTMSATEVPALVDRLATANPDAVYYSGAAGIAAGLIRQARTAGMRVVWVLSNSANVPELASLAGPQNIAGTYIVADPSPGLREDPISQRFVTAYRSTYNAEPTLWGAMAADSFLLFQEALRNTNSSDPQALAGYLHDRLRGYSGITGVIEGFDSTGDRIGTGDIILVVTPDGRTVLAAEQP